uniref:Uncharacterized protein n=1 Tax=Glossina palpalis gambiensis TaxID=67801 RepID=A0A1B0BLA8_9MUSC
MYNYFLYKISFRYVRSGSLLTRPTTAIVCIVYSITTLSQRVSKHLIVPSWEPEAQYCCRFENCRVVNRFPIFRSLIPFFGSFLRLRLGRGSSSSIGAQKHFPLSSQVHVPESDNIPRLLSLIERGPIILLPAMQSCGHANSNTERPEIKMLEERMEGRKAISFASVAFHTQRGDLSQDWKTAEGACIAILNPKVFDNRAENGDVACLTIDVAQKVMILGQSKDLGACKARKRNRTNFSYGPPNYGELVKFCQEPFENATKLCGLHAVAKWLLTLPSPQFH